MSINCSPICDGGHLSKNIMYKEVTRMKVIHNDFAVAWHNALFAVTDGKDIYIDDNFYKLSNNLKKFVLKHEEGHIVLNHIGSKEYDVFREEEADKYAFKHTSIEAAQEFIKILSLDDSRISKSRVINLKGMIAQQNIIDSGDECRINTLLNIYDEIADLFGDMAEQLQSM